MELKIFNVGFTEKEFNDFCNENLVYRYHVIDNGTVYIFYKNPQDLGKRPIELAEDLDRMVKQAQTEKLTYQVDIESHKNDIEKLKADKEGKFPNQDEWKKLDTEIASKELSIKMAQDTIKSHDLKIEGVFAKLPTILNIKK